MFGRSTCVLAIAFSVSIAQSIGFADTNNPARSDGEVINAILIDLLTYTGKDSPAVSGNGHTEPTLLFSIKTVTISQTQECVLQSVDAKSWEQIEQQYRGAVVEAASNLVGRIGSVESLVAYVPNDKRIQLFPIDKQIGLLDIRPIRTWLPGYSQDGTIALVRLTIPWSIHHSLGTYILRRERERWIVVVRQFAHSP